MFGIERVFEVNGEAEDLPTPAHLWQESHANGEVKRLTEYAGELPSFVNQSLFKVHGICSYRTTEGDTFPYMVGAFRSENSNTEDYTKVTIPAHMWAIFPSKKFEWDNFNHTIETLYKRVFSEWMPTSGYEQAGPQLEVYGGEGELGYVELWFAVRKIASKQ